MCRFVHNAQREICRAMHTFTYVTYLPLYWQDNSDMPKRWSE